MSARTGIEWTDATWNPIRGCSLVSEGCRNCYAMNVATRFSGEGQPYEGLAERRSNGEPRWTGEVRVIDDHMLDPIRWQKPRRVFVNSMSDLFHENVSDETLDVIFAIMALASHHTFQVLTKRAARMAEYLNGTERKRTIAARVMDVSNMLAATAKNHKARVNLDHFSDCFAGPGPFRNIHLGVSVENQAAAHERIPLLLETPAAIRFLSCEPLLGAINLFSWLAEKAPSGYARLSIWYGPEGFDPSGSQPERTHVLRNPAPIDWIIAGGESGAHARPMHPDWARVLREQCGVAGIPFFFKQWGEHIEVPFDADNPERAPGDRWLNWAGGHGFHGESVVRIARVGKRKAGRELDGRTWDEFPVVPEVPHAS